MPARISFVALMLVCAPVLAQKMTLQPSPGSMPSIGSVTATVESRAETMRFQFLVDQLVITRSDYYVNGSESNVRMDSLRRIDDAAEALEALGKRAWPVLMMHLGDRRDSSAATQTTGPHTVGRYCSQILRRQVVVLPAQYPQSKTSRDHDIDSLFAPDIQSWLLRRENRSLEEIQVEVLEYLELLEQRANQPPQVKADKVRAIEGQIESLRARLVRLSALPIAEPRIERNGKPDWKPTQQLIGRRIVAEGIAIGFQKGIGDYIEVAGERLHVPNIDIASNKAHGKLVRVVGTLQVVETAPAPSGTQGMQSPGRFVVLRDAQIEPIRTAIYPCVLEAK